MYSNSLSCIGRMVLMNACKVVVYHMLTRLHKYISYLNSRCRSTECVFFFFGSHHIHVKESDRCEKKVHFRFVLAFFGNVNKSENNSGNSGCAKPYENILWLWIILRRSFFCRFENDRDILRHRITHNKTMHEMTRNDKLNDKRKQGKSKNIRLFIFKSCPQPVN